MSLNYKLEKLLVALANKFNHTPSDGYKWIDNTNYISKEYLQSYVDENPEVTIAYFLSGEGWIDVTDKNAKEVIHMLNRDILLDQMKREQEESEAK